MIWMIPGGNMANSYSFMLEDAANKFVSEEGNRKYVANVGLALLEMRPVVYSTDEAIARAKAAAKQACMELVVVAIGDEVDMDALQQVADPKFIVQEKSYEVRAHSHSMGNSWR